MEAALFGDLKLIDTGTSPRKKENVALVGRSSDGQRNRWQGTYNPLVPSDEGKKDPVEKSLLD